MKNCLVIIDVQNGFLSDRTEHVPVRLQQLLRGKHNFDHVVATQFKNVDGGPYTELMGWYGLLSEDSQKLHPFVSACSEKVFVKNIYSCFTREFELYLEEQGIDKLYFAGIDTDCCVLMSAADCFERNIPFEVLLYYCASNGGPASHEAAILVMERTIGRNLMRKEKLCGAAEEDFE